jgi:hypothetical protein
MIRSIKLFLGKDGDWLIRFYSIWYRFSFSAPPSRSWPFVASSHHFPGRLRIGTVTTLLPACPGQRSDDIRLSPRRRPPGSILCHDAHFGRNHPTCHRLYSKCPNEESLFDPHGPQFNLPIARPHCRFSECCDTIWHDNSNRFANHKWVQLRSFGILSRLMALYFMSRLLLQLSLEV